MSLHIAVDMDDVCLDFFGGVIAAMSREFDVELRKEDCTTWDKNPVKEFDWTSYGYKSWWDWMRKRDWLWSNFQAVPGALGGLSALRAEGHYVECLTSKPEWAEPQVWKWLGRWRPPFQQVTIVGLNDRKCDASDADVLIDDKVSNLTEWVESETFRYGILFDQPWSRGFSCGWYADTRILRVTDWSEVLKAVRLVEGV